MHRRKSFQRPIEPCAKWSPYILTVSNRCTVSDRQSQSRDSSGCRGGVRRPRCLDAVDGEGLPVLSHRHHEGKSVLRAHRGEIGRMLEVEKRSVGNSEKRYWPHRFLCGIPRCESYRDEANLRLTCRPKQPWPRPSPPLLQSKCASIPVRPHLAIPNTMGNQLFIH